MLATPAAASRPRSATLGRVYRGRSIASPPHTAWSRPPRWRQLPAPAPPPRPRLGGGRVRQRGSHKGRPHVPATPVGSVHTGSRSLPDGLALVLSKRGEHLEDEPA